MLSEDIITLLEKNNIFEEDELTETKEIFELIDKLDTDEDTDEIREKLIILVK
jgi:hypothetical protein